MAIAQRGLALDQFLQLPEEEPALEFAEGTVTRKVSPRGKHSRLQILLSGRLEQAGHPHELAVVFTELRTTFAGVSRVPDIAVYRWNRVPIDAANEVANEFRTPPDVAIEIVSPEQSVNSLVRRCLWYVANGVTIALLVDPADKSILAFRPGQEAMAWHGADRIDLSEILPDFDLTVEGLFALLRMR